MFFLLTITTNLKRDPLHCRILEKTVIRIEHLFGEKEEPFPGHSAVVEAHLAVKFHPQLRLEQFRSGYSAYDSERVLQYGRPMHFNFKLVRYIGLSFSKCQLLYSFKTLGVLNTGFLS